MWLVGLLVVVLSAGTVAITQIAGAASNPGGNNGTIKIDGTPFDDLPNNEPHVGCTFQVDFYGYDKGDLFADVTFEAQPPTLRPGDDQVLLSDTVFIGEDDNSGGGSQAGLDASKTYTLDFTGITPHPQQGFHVKLTIHADGSKGADTKHKVFWVTGCEAPPTTTTTTTGPTTTVGETTTTVGETTTTVGETTTSVPESTISPTTSTVGETTTTEGATTTTEGATTTSEAETTTTVGETTTTVGETTTSVPESTISPTTSTVGETTTTAEEATTTTAAGGNQPTTSGQSPSSQQLAETSQPLPRTGANVLPMVVAGVLLVLVGVGGLLASRRLRAR